MKLLGFIAWTVKLVGLVLQVVREFITTRTVEAGFVRQEAGLVNGRHGGVYAIFRSPLGSIQNVTFV